MTVGPDIAGFADAQDRLREALGRDITFKVPEPKTWGPDVSLDPETGAPYDPTAVPTSGGGFAEIAIKVTVVRRPLTRNVEDQVASGLAVGPMDEGVAALLVKASDFATIEDATEFVLGGKDYRITDMNPDTDAPYPRYIIFGQAT